MPPPISFPGAGSSVLSSQEEEEELELVEGDMGNGAFECLELEEIKSWVWEVEEYAEKVG